jgi:DNA topoisomerase-2
MKSDNDSILATKYQQKTDKQHILDNPDTYVGSVEHVESKMWIMNSDNTQIIEKDINYIPALFKLFDEGIVNCRDHVIRMQQAIDNGNTKSLPVSYIDISIGDDGTISMVNDGNGIDIAKHPEYDIWIPELIFGHLRTSTNYDKSEKKIVGGKNGFGFKLVLIWSQCGSVETIDHVRGLKYIQSFEDNLNIINKPKITKCKTKPYTKITFKPDYQRLGLPNGLTPDLIALLKRRIYDIGAITNKSIKVKYDSNDIPIKSFLPYIDLYIGSKDDKPRVFEEGAPRWEYAVALAPNQEFMHVSFVNGIHTNKGGKHVEYILNQITRKMVAYIDKKKKITVTANSIKEQLILFLRCDIENPSFDSQTKDYMNTPFNKFGSTCSVSDKFIEKLAKMGVMESACAITEVKDQKQAKKTDGTKSKNIKGIPKLIDANWAGTSKSSECTIIFCEGDSAKAGIVSGLSSSDRNTIGVYPMKGKMLNVRGEITKKISENKEVIDIKKILGLEMGKKYTEPHQIANLRYGKILFMTDQDLDGSHIKGLGINLFQSQWNSLSKIPNFIGFMNTPILKAKKGNQELNFYNEGEYQEWKDSNNIDGWKIKYYKGLGTSTGKEFREYFQDRKTVAFSYNGDHSDNAIDMVFNKKRADDRKVWLGNYSRDNYLDTNVETINYEDFINKELIHFSKYDCDRSIPNIMDGLKISLRKILFAAFKKNLTQEIKVAQFTGYVSEHSGYHHGEASLNGAIVGMAQNFVGSNNINLFMPNGQFGTRLQGGKDSASERYIFTQLSKITRYIFPDQDDKVLKYLDDDGLSVEPTYYTPIIPMILVNGTKGIGTGFSTDIMCYKPLNIIRCLKNKLKNITESIDFFPYYEGFQGTILKLSDERYLIKGNYQRTGNDQIQITELPIGTWTDDYKEYIEHLMDTVDKNGKKIIPIVKDYDDMSKDTNVNIIINLYKGKLNELENNQIDQHCNGLEKIFKLFTTNSNTNMHLFDSDDKLKKYATVEDIINDYYITRLQTYQIRKDYLIKALTQDLLILSNKAKYITDVLNDVIDLRKKTKEQVSQMLSNHNYAIINNDTDYKYLTKLPMDSVTEENVDKITTDCEKKKEELDIITNTTIQQTWLNELGLLESEYMKYKDSREKLMNSDTVDSSAKKTKKKALKIKK